MHTAWLVLALPRQTAHPGHCNGEVDFQDTVTEQSLLTHTGVLCVNVCTATF